MSDPWNSEYRKIWRATYGAMFALLVQTYKAKYPFGGGPSAATYSNIAREASVVAAAAAERGEP